MTSIDKIKTGISVGMSPLKSTANLNAVKSGVFRLNFDSTEILLLRIEMLIQTYKDDNERLRAENRGLANCYCGAAKTKHEHPSDIAVNCREISENDEEI